MKELGAAGARWLITIVATALICLHLYFPALPIDAVTVALVVILVLPWTAPLVESLDLPGGWKIKFQAVEAAARKITASNPQPSATSEPPAVVTLPQADAVLGLVGLRIEIEKRLRALAQRHHLRDGLSLSRLVQELQQKQVLLDETASGLRDLIAIGNRAAHGQHVEPAVGEWVEFEGPRILAILDMLVALAAPTPKVSATAVEQREAADEAPEG